MKMNIVELLTPGFFLFLDLSPQSFSTLSAGSLYPGLPESQQWPQPRLQLRVLAISMYMSAEEPFNA